MGHTNFPSIELSPMRFKGFVPCPPHGTRLEVPCVLQFLRHQSMEGDCLQIGQFLSQVSLYLHNYNSKKLEETRMRTLLQSTVLSICVIPELAALVSSFDFDKTSVCTERDSNRVLLCNEKRNMDRFAVAY